MIHKFKRSKLNIILSICLIISLLLYIPLTALAQYKAVTVFSEWSDGMYDLYKSLGTKRVSSVANLIYDGKQYVYVDSLSRIFTSTDLINWNKQCDEKNFFVSAYDMAYDGGTYVIAGRDGNKNENGGYDWGCIKTSQNLQDWSLNLSTIDITGKNGELNAITFGDRFVAVGYNCEEYKNREPYNSQLVVAFSKDLSEWKSVFLTDIAGESTTLTDVIYANGYYYIIGDKGFLARSSDCMSWEK